MPWTWVSASSPLRGKDLASLRSLPDGQPQGRAPCSLPRHSGSTCLCWKLGIVFIHSHYTFFLFQPSAQTSYFCTFSHRFYFSFWINGIFCHHHPPPRQKVGSETTCWARCNHNHLSCEYLHVLGLCSWDKGHEQQLGVMPSSHRSEEVCGETGSPLLETPKLRSQDTLNSQLFSLNPWLVAKLETLKNVTCIFQLGSSSILNSDLALSNRNQEKIAILFTYRARPMLLSAHLHLLIPT